MNIEHELTQEVIPVFYSKFRKGDKVRLTSYGIEKHSQTHRTGTVMCTHRRFSRKVYVKPDNRTNSRDYEQQAWEVI